METRRLFPLCLLLALLAATVGRADEAKPQRILIKAARLIDGLSDKAREGAAVLVEGDKILEVGAAVDLARKSPDARVIDLGGGATLLPGLIDLHTHVFVHGVVPPDDYDDQLLKESIPYRAIGATAAARAALSAGFTSIRDVETEGAMYADVDLKTAIARGVVPGPRMQVASRGMAPTGVYALLGYSWELRVPEGVQVVDGVEGARRAVREQIKYGADWIKVYADLSPYLTTRADRPLRSRPNFTPEELRAIVDEAHRRGHKVAAHAMGWDGIDAALTAGVDSIEHGTGLTDDLLDRMLKQGVTWCPTIYALIWVARAVPPAQAIVDIEKAAFRRALAKGVKIANGSDAGSYPWTENPAKEIALLVDYGMTPPQAIRAATSVAAALLDPLCAPDAKGCPKSDVGVLAPGKHADLIAVDGDPLGDIKTLQKVRFVMKAGAVFKE